MVSSKLIDLFAVWYGDYKTTLPRISLLTQKEVLQVLHLRTEKPKANVLLVQELERNEKLNVGLMKELTVGDTEARGLFKELIQFKPHNLN